MDKNYCRLCLKLDLWHSPLSLIDEGFEILTKIDLIYGIQISEDDSFSKVICHLCLGKLAFIDSIRRKVTNSNSILLEISGEKALNGRSSGEPHVQNQVEGKRSDFRCHKCRFSTHNINSLEVHMQLHDGEYQRDCPHCEQVFLFEDELVHHAKRKHKLRRLAVEYCPLCSTVIYGSEAFHSHSLQHVPSTLAGCSRSSGTCDLNSHSLQPNPTTLAECSGDASTGQKRCCSEGVQKMKKKRRKEKARSPDAPRERIVLKISKSISNEDEDRNSCEIGDPEEKTSKVQPEPSGHPNAAETNLDNLPRPEHSVEMLSQSNATKSQQDNLPRPGHPAEMPHSNATKTHQDDLQRPGHSAEMPHSNATKTQHDNLQGAKLSAEMLPQSSATKSQEDNLPRPKLSVEMLSSSNATKTHQNNLQGAKLSAEMLPQSSATKSQEDNLPRPKLSVEMLSSSNATKTHQNNLQGAKLSAEMLPQSSATKSQEDNLPRPKLSVEMLPSSDATKTHQNILHGPKLCAEMLLPFTTSKPKRLSFSSAQSTSTSDDVGSPSELIEFLGQTATNERTKFGRYENFGSGTSKSNGETKQLNSSEQMRSGEYEARWEYVEEEDGRSRQIVMEDSSDSDLEIVEEMYTHDKKRFAQRQRENMLRQASEDSVINFRGERLQLPKLMLTKTACPKPVFSGEENPSLDNDWDSVSASEKIYIDVDEDNEHMLEIDEERKSMEDREEDCMDSFHKDMSLNRMELEDVIEIKDEY